MREITETELEQLAEEAAREARKKRLAVGETLADCVIISGRQETTRK